MKSLMSILSLVAVTLLSYCASAQQSSASKNTSSSSSLVIDTIKVTGVCGMCKRRIETAVYGVKGVKNAAWDSKKQALTVSYDSKKATNEAIQNRIAAAGHDTERVKADDKAYGKLPDCCRYRDGVEVHEN